MLRSLLLNPYNSSYGYNLYYTETGASTQTGTETGPETANFQNLKLDLAVESHLRHPQVLKREHFRDGK